MKYELLIFKILAYKLPFYNIKLNFNINLQAANTKQKKSFCFIPSFAFIIFKITNHKLQLKIVKSKISRC